MKTTKTATPFCSQFAKSAGSLKPNAKVIPLVPAKVLENASHDLCFENDILKEEVDALKCGINEYEDAAENANEIIKRLMTQIVEARAASAKWKAIAEKLIAGEIV